VNTARTRLRRVARALIGSDGYGDVELFIGRGEGIDPWLAVTQGGLLVGVRQEPFTGPELALHRELLRAILAAGYGLVAELPLAVPLNKGRSGAIAGAARSVDAAIARAFERFVLEDALFDRELLRAVDHRLASVLDRLVLGALGGEAPPAIGQQQAIDDAA